MSWASRGHNNERTCEIEGKVRWLVGVSGGVG